MVMGVGEFESEPGMLPCFQLSSAVLSASRAREGSTAWALLDEQPESAKASIAISETMTMPSVPYQVMDCSALGSDWLCVEDDENALNMACLRLSRFLSSYPR